MVLSGEQMLEVWLMNWVIQGECDLLPSFIKGAKKIHMTKAC